MIAEYFWLGGENEFRSKIKIVKSMSEISDWDYDGSSTKQADGNNSEVILKPVSMCKNPFYKGMHYLVLCATYKSDGTPLENNYRDWAEEIFNKYLDEQPWYGLEQEYFIITPLTKLPYGYNDTNLEQGQYYCSVGCSNAFGRQIADEHMLMCLEAELQISGINSEVAVGQWEFQIGPVKGIQACDQLLIARYILERIAEKHNLEISYKPKLLNNWNGSGCHTNFSTKKMRDDDNGIDEIFKAIDKLSKKHTEHMMVYGDDNKTRLTGIHETSSFEKFSYGVANRGSSIRIGNKTFLDKKGYFEDRRPAANINPYLVTATLLQTIMSDNIILY